MGAVNSASCPNNCNAAAGGGTCNAATDICECNELRAGFGCSIILCVDNCNGPDRGICDQGVCFCNANYTGDLCQFRTCLGGCGEEVNHGTCDDGTCICVSDDVGSWNGPTCDTFSVNCAPRDCSGHGVCPISLSSQCDCDNGWDFSPFCDISDADAPALHCHLHPPLLPAARQLDLGTARPAPHRRPLWPRPSKAPPRRVRFCPRKNRCPPPLKGPRRRLVWRNRRPHRNRSRRRRHLCPRLWRLLFDQEKAPCRCPCQA